MENVFYTAAAILGLIAAFFLFVVYLLRGTMEELHHACEEPFEDIS